MELNKDLFKNVDGINLGLDQLLLTVLTNQLTIHSKVDVVLAYQERLLSKSEDLDIEELRNKTDGKIKEGFKNKTEDLMKTLLELSSSKDPK